MYLSLIGILKRVFGVRYAVYVLVSSTLLSLLVFSCSLCHRLHWLAFQILSRAAKATQPYEVMDSSQLFSLYIAYELRGLHTNSSVTCYIFTGGKSRRKIPAADHKGAKDEISPESKRTTRQNSTASATSDGPAVCVTEKQQEQHTATSEIKEGKGEGRLTRSNSTKSETQEADWEKDESATAEKSETRRTRNNSGNCKRTQENEKQRRDVNKEGSGVVASPECREKRSTRSESREKKKRTQYDESGEETHNKELGEEKSPDQGRKSRLRKRHPSGEFHSQKSNHTTNPERLEKHSSESRDNYKKQTQGGEYKELREKSPDQSRRSSLRNHHPSGECCGQNGFLTASLERISESRENCKKHTQDGGEMHKELGAEKSPEQGRRSRLRKPRSVGNSHDEKENVVSPERVEKRIVGRESRESSGKRSKHEEAHTEQGTKKSEEDSEDEKDNAEETDKAEEESVLAVYFVPSSSPLTGRSDAVVMPEKIYTTMSTRSIEENFRRLRVEMSDVLDKIPGAKAKKSAGTEDSSAKENRPPRGKKKSTAEVISLFLTALSITFAQH